MSDDTLEQRVERLEDCLRVSDEYETRACQVGSADLRAILTALREKEAECERLLENLAQERLLKNTAHVELIRAGQEIEEWRASASGYGSDALAEKVLREQAEAALEDERVHARAFWQAESEGALKLQAAESRASALSAETARLKAEVASLRASMGEANGVEPAGCPCPGACSALALSARVAGMVEALDGGFLIEHSTGSPDSEKRSAEMRVQWVGEGSLEKSRRLIDAVRTLRTAHDAVLKDRP